MKKLLIKTGVLIIVFILGVLGFGQLTNKTNEDLTKDMASATLPVFSLYVGDTQVNELKGYVKEMNPVYMRDAITPIDDSRVLPIQIHTYQNKVTALSYEIRSLDTKRLIAETKVTDFQQQKESIKSNLQIQNLLELNQEYLMIFKLEVGKKTIYYYTRIMQESGTSAKDCVQFALDFHDKTFDKSKASELATYLEPDSTGDNSTLSRVTIHSSLKQVQWANFKGDQLTKPVPSIKEISSTYTTIVLTYLMESKGDNGELEYYNVTEYYRVRYTESRMYLLNFERTMNQIFRAENQNTYDNYLQLGIRDKDVEHQSNEKGTIVAFVQEGELWSFNETTNQISQVFSFNSNEGIDTRENYLQHDIRIINVDEMGSINFVVYGYMNAGLHEGEVGITVYHYDSIANTVEEELFIPTTESYQIMKEDLGQLMYENTQGIFFILLDGTVYRIDLSNMETKTYIENVDEGMYAISDSHKYFAWSDGKNSDSGTTIHVMDLDSEKSRDITAPAGTYIKPLDFMGDDLIYGAANQQDVVTDLAGNTTFPISTVYIVSGQDLKQLKQYQKDGYYVSSIEVSDYIIYLNRIQNNGMAYVDAPQDTIMNRDAETKATVTLHTTVTDERQTQVQLSMADVVKEADPKVMTPKQVVFTNNREVPLKGDNPSSYYAYAWGNVLTVTDNLQSAINSANSSMGVVIGEQQEYIWKRARSSSKNSIEVAVGPEDVGKSSIAQCVSAMLQQQSVNIGVSALIDQGKTPKEILENTMDGVMALDLTGCTLEEVLYYISLGNPVFAMKSNSDAVLLTGYDAKTITIFDPVTGSKSSMSMTDASTMFANAGDVFFGYIKE